jgi:hypothetical protein
MAAARKDFGRDAQDDAEARAWVAEIQELAEAGLLKDDTDEVRRMLAEEVAKLAL